jgi:superfamily II DNA or RNA helicase
MSAGFQDLPDLSRESLLELAGGIALRAGRELARNGKVSEVQWQAPELSGTVDDLAADLGSNSASTPNAGAADHLPVRINLKSLTFARVQCPCAAGRAGRFCQHAVALCFAVQAAAEAAAAELPPPNTGGSRLPAVRRHFSAKPAPGPAWSRPSTARPAASAAASHRQPGASHPGRPPPSHRAVLNSAGRMEIDGSPHYLAIRLPDRDHPLHSRAAALLRDEGFRNEPSNGRWWLRDQHKTLNFLARHGRALRTTFDPVFTANYTARMRGVRDVGVGAQVEAAGDDYQLSLALQANGLDEAALRRALAAGTYYVVQADAIWLLDPAMLERFAASAAAIAGDPALPFVPTVRTRLRPHQLADAERILEELETEAQLPADWKARSAALRSVDNLQPAPLPPHFDAGLRHYQRIGVAWLWHLWQHQLGGVLADEMGLGKTVQALGLIAAIRGSAAHAGPILVVCPAGLVGNWSREAGRFLPGLQSFVHHRDSRLGAPPEAAAYDVVITSYATLSQDQPLFADCSFAAIIADEAQHIKNRRTQAARDLRSLTASSRFVLTGTPIENSLDDLRSLFAFCLPGYLKQLPAGTKGDERAWYDTRHREQAAPYILRRDKVLVAPDLPPKLEQVVLCDLEPAQRRQYTDIQQASQRRLLDLQAGGASENKLRFAALVELLRLRQVCADPGLLDDQAPIEHSAKWLAFREILDEAIDGGHRVLVFSQFVPLLQRLRLQLSAMGLATAYIDGSSRDRMAEVDRFQSNADIPVFLISLKAGGTGLNLTAADTVVFFDPWWNPAVEDQAADRAHRIGQHRAVTVYKLIAAGTVEEKVRALQTDKAELLRALLDESAAHTAMVNFADLTALING